MEQNDYKIRLQKFISDCGYTSRRKAEDLIVQGKVMVNGKVASVLGTKVNPHKDVVMIDGNVIDLKMVDKKYIILNKPRGYVTTLHDPEGRPTIMELCREVSERIYPVGRLDYLSEGLLILTNDGELGNTIMHPSYEVSKVYEVKVFGAISKFILKKLQSGVQLDDGFAKPQSVRIIKQLPSKTWLEFRLVEGRNREIRRICEAVGLTIDKLKRVAIEGLSVEGIKPGGFRYTTKHKILRALGMNADGTRNKNFSARHLSTKKTVRVKSLGKGVHANSTQADDRAFYKFRKESYFDTLKAIKETKLAKETRPTKD